MILINEIETNNVFDEYNGNLTSLKNLYDRILKEYKISPSMYDIPFMYALPKFHKNPISFRFITSSFNCISKSVSVFLNVALDKLSFVISMESDSNWIINNNNKVLKALNELNSNNIYQGDSMVATFDFSTLYTTLPHNDLIRCIVALYNKYVSADLVIYYEKKKIILTKSKFVEILKFCILNNYISFNGKIYKQVVGIPMGANYSPNLANLYLHFYETKFMNININEYRLVYKFTFRFIDDLLSLKNRAIITDISTIYPESLEIKNTNTAPHTKCSFLDLDIEIANGNFTHKIYDKRRDYNFEILGLPSTNSNIPNKSIYGVLCSQFCRYASNCRFREDFLLNCQLLINKLLHNKCPSYLLKKFVRKFEFNKRLTLSKFNLDLALCNFLEF